ncbi:MAG: ATP-grasp domain-containing protein [Pleurocapsa sp.]
MDLLEYQAKELFREIGIPTLPSQSIDEPRQIKQLQIPYPVVLKSQVRSGGRGKAGGVRFVSNTIDAIAATRAIFKLSILGEYPEVVLAEAHYNSEKEFFLAIVLDYELKRPVLLGSARGGMNVESLLANLQQVVVEDDFSPFYARRLTTRMGLSGGLIQSVSQIIEKMYRLFVTKDLDLIEINPLGVNTKGEVMALDGKITVNDSALFRHQAIAAFQNSRQLSFKRQSSPVDDLRDTSPVSVRWLDWNNAKGNIAIVCNSFDLALLTWDLICQRKKHPACAVTITNNTFNEPTAASAYGEQLKKVLTQLMAMPKIKVILLNIWETEAISRQIVTQTFNCALTAGIKQLESTTEKKSRSVNLHHGDTSEKTSRQNSVSKSFSSEVKFVLRLLNRDFLKNTEFPENLVTTMSDITGYTEDDNGFIYQPDEESIATRLNLAESVYVTDNLPEAISETLNLVKLK